MTESERKPAAHEDTKADTRTAAKWLVAAFAAVGAAMLSGVGLAGIGSVEGDRLYFAIAAFAFGVLGVIAAVSLITDVLTPAPVTIAKLAKYASRRNAGLRGCRNDALVAYVESDPSFLQGIVDRRTTPDDQLLITASDRYRDAIDERFRSAETYWSLVKTNGVADQETKQAEEKAKAAGKRASAMHATVRRLEQIATGQQTVISFKARRTALAMATLVVAASIGVFAFASNPPQPETADLRGANLEKVDLSGASLREANLSGMTLRKVNFDGTNLEGAKIDKTVWENTTCPDGTNSDNAGKTCAGHLNPVYEPDPLP